MPFRRGLGVVLAALALVLLSQAPPGNAQGEGETIGVAVPGRVSCGQATNLRPGQTVPCTIAGFGATEQVDVALTAPLGTVTTDADGGATYDFTVPADIAAGSYTLTFTGETSKAVGSFACTVGVAEVTSTSGTPAPPASTGGGGQHLAFTGVDVLAMAAAALALLGAGVTLTVLNRRRRYR